MYLDNAQHCILLTFGKIMKKWRKRVTFSHCDLTAVIYGIGEQ